MHYPSALSSLHVRPAPPGFDSHTANSGIPQSDRIAEALAAASAVKKRADETTTALQPSRWPEWPLLLRPHSPTTAFESLGRPCQAPDTTPAAIAVPVLFLTFAQAVTSLAGVTRRARMSYVRISRSGIVSIENSFSMTLHDSGNLAPAATLRRAGSNRSFPGPRKPIEESSMISRGRTQKLPGNPRHQAFTVRHRLSLGLTCKGFRPVDMVELFVMIGFPSHAASGPGRGSASHLVGNSPRKPG